MSQRKAMWGWGRRGRGAALEMQLQARMMVYSSRAPRRTLRHTSISSIQRARSRLVNTPPELPPHPALETERHAALVCPSRCVYALQAGRTIPLQSAEPTFLKQ